MHFYIRFSTSSKVQLIISVPKKIFKGAVTRNTIKRRVRAVTRELVEKLNNGLYLIVAMSGAENIKGANLKKELEVLFASYMS